MEPFFDSAFLKKLELLTILSRKVFAGKIRGEQRSSKRGTSVEFADYRSYSFGDDFRHIDWNAYARLEHLFLKLFMEEQDLNIHILVDRSRSMGHGEPPKLDYARRVSAALAYVGLANQDRVSIAGFTERRGPIKPLTRGKGRIFEVFDFLAALEPDAKTSLRGAVSDFCARVKKAGVVIVISDFLDPAGYEEALKRLKYSIFEPMVIHLLSEDELAPRIGGDYRLIDAETDARVDLSMDARAVRQYEQRLKAFCEGLEGYCKRHAIGYLRSATNVAFEDLVLNYLRRAAFVR